MQERRQPEIIAGVVNSDGSIARGDGFTVQKIGTGNYTVTFTSGFRLIAMTSTCGNISAGVTRYAATDERSVTMYTFVSNTGTASDSAFSFIATGTQQ